jgi:hypothetical protein
VFDEGRVPHPQRPEKRQTSAHECDLREQDHRDCEERPERSYAAAEDVRPPTRGGNERERDDVDRAGQSERPECSEGRPARSGRRKLRRDESRELLSISEAPYRVSVACCFLEVIPGLREHPFQVRTADTERPEPPSELREKVVAHVSTARIART